MLCDQSVNIRKNCVLVAELVPPGQYEAEAVGARASYRLVEAAEALPFQAREGPRCLERHRGREGPTPRHRVLGRRDPTRTTLR